MALLVSAEKGIHNFLSGSYISATKSCFPNDNPVIVTCADGVPDIFGDLLRQDFLEHGPKVICWEASALRGG